MRLSAVRAVPSLTPNSAHHCTSRLAASFGRLHPEQEAGDHRPGRERPVEQRRPILRSCIICSESVTSGRDDLRTHDAARPRGARALRPHRTPHRQRATRANAFRDELRRIPNVRNAFAVVVALRADDRDHRRRGLDRQPASCGRSRSCSWAARTRSSPRSCTKPRTACCSATGASTTGSDAGCSASRRSRRSTSTAAGTWRTTATSSDPTSPTSRSTAATPSAAASMRRKLTRDADGPNRAGSSSRACCAASASTDAAVRSQARRIVGDAAAAHRDRHRAGSPVGLLHPVARAVSHGVARDQPACVRSPSTAACNARRTVASRRTPCGSFRWRASSSCRTTSAGTSRTTSTPASRWRTSRSCTPSCARAGYVTDELEYPSYLALWKQARSAEPAADPVRLGTVAR